jgi:hypothetical protein
MSQSHVAAFDAYCNWFLAEGLVLTLRLREITHPNVQLRQFPATGGSLHIDSGKLTTNSSSENSNNKDVVK